MGRTKLASAELPRWLCNGAGCAFKEEDWNQSMGSSSPAAQGAAWLRERLPRLCLVLPICKIIGFFWEGGRLCCLMREWKDAYL